MYMYVHIMLHAVAVVPFLLVSLTDDQEAAMIELLTPFSKEWMKIAEKGLKMEKNEVDEISAGDDQDVNQLKKCVRKWKNKDPNWRTMISVLGVVIECLKERAMKKG